MSDTTQPGADNALDLDKLEALARAATPGEWKVEPLTGGGHHNVRIRVRGPVVSGYAAALNTRWANDEQAAEQEANAAHIAAANPETVLALIALARRAAQPVEAAHFDFHGHLARQAAWSTKTFGPGPRTAGVCDHIRKELREIEADPTDLREWIDVVILALDGAWRCGGSPEQIIDGIVAKQTKNEGRNWPDWRTADPNKAIEHDRSGEAATHPAEPVAGAPVNCSSTPDSCPDNEGYGCYCSPAMPAVGGALVAKAHKIISWGGGEITLASLLESLHNYSRIMPGAEGRAKWAMREAARYIEAMSAAPAGALVAITDEQQDQAKIMFTVEQVQTMIAADRAQRATAKFEAQGMAECMDMVRQELIEAGVIPASTAPMMVANAVLTYIRAQGGVTQANSAESSSTGSAAAPAEPIYQIFTDSYDAWYDVEKDSYDRTPENLRRIVIATNDLPIPTGEKE